VKGRSSMPADWLPTSDQRSLASDGMVLFIKLFNFVFSYRCGEYNAVDSAQEYLYTIVRRISV